MPALRRLNPTLLFFQLEMQGGIFQSCWSLTVSGRGGECITGTGGDPGPRGTCRQGGRAFSHAWLLAAASLWPAAQPA